MPKPMHTSGYHMYISRYSKEPSRRDNSHELPTHMFKPVYRRTSITCASFSYLAAEILCCGYPWESSHETTPMSTQNTFINQCTREHTLTVLANFVITVSYKQVLLIRNVNYTRLRKNLLPPSISVHTLELDLTILESDKRKHSFCISL